MTKGFRRADRAEAADPVALAAYMRTEAAMHWNAAHRVVATLSGVAARDIGDQPRRQQPHIAEPAAAEQHLIERRHPASGGVAAAAWHPSGLELRRIIAWLRRVGVGAAFLLARWHPDKDVIGQPERRE